jgi:hypothetical protein
MSKFSARVALVAAFSLVPTVASAAPAVRSFGFFDRIAETVQVVLEWLAPTPDKDDGRAEQHGDG